MNEYNLNDKINIDEKEVKVKNLTLDDLYYLYEKQRTISLVKIINGDLKLFLEKEE